MSAKQAKGGVSRAFEPDSDPTASAGAVTFIVNCEILADDGPRRVSLTVTAADSDDAAEEALWRLDQGRVTGVRRRKLEKP